MTTQMLGKTALIKTQPRAVFLLTVILFFTLLFVFAGISSQGHSQGQRHDNFEKPVPLEVPENSQRLELNRAAQFLRDSENSIDLQGALLRQDWRKNSAGSVLNFGFTEDSVWVRLVASLPPPSAMAWYLVIPYPLLETVELYLFDSQGLLQFHSTLAQARQSQSIDSQQLGFLLPRHLSGPVTMLLRVQSTTSLQVPLELWSQAYLVQRQVQETLLWGLYFGVLLALMSYNGFLYFSVRDIAYCYYSLYLAASAGVMLCLSGMGVVYLWPPDASFNRHALSFFTGLTSLSLLAFARSFLDWSGFPVLLHRLLAVGALISASLIVYAWFFPVQGAKLSAWVATIAISIAIVAGLYALHVGLVIARFFVLAFAMFAGGASLYLLNVFGVLPVSRVTNHAIQMGSALEAVLLSLALAHRIKEDRQSALRALQQKHVAEQQVQQLELTALDYAMHDPLTHMPNDSLLLTRLQELLRADREPLHFGLVLMQFPQMREISSSLGRAMAEPLFVKLVQDLNHTLSLESQAIVIEAKIGAFVAVTEFGSLVFLARADENGLSLRAYAENFRGLYDNAFDVGNISVNLDAFCGLAESSLCEGRADVLLQQANATLEHGHRNGERVCLFSADIDAYGHRRLALMGALSRALQDGELELYVQPQLDCIALTLVGAEILLRWNSPRHGLVPTQEFIDIAENAGMMYRLTRYVVSRGMVLLRQLQAQGMTLSLSINLSVQNLVEPDFVRFVTDTASAQGVDLHDLVLEVTETSASENIDAVIDNLNLLAQTGCSISLDDFGTGYSSLTYLSRLPIHELKIDRSFIIHMARSDSDLRIVENTLKLARILHIQTVAEGVEDADMLSTLALLGCDRVQGYHLGKPMPVKQFHAWALRKAS